MSGNCSSSPTSGCGSSGGQSLGSFDEFASNYADHLRRIIQKKSSLLEVIDECCEVNNGKLRDFKLKLHNVKQQAIDCCVTVNSNLDDVLRALDLILSGGGACDDNGKPPVTDPPTPPTTQEPPPVTQEPPPPPTTQEPPPIVPSARFDLDSDYDFICTSPYPPAERNVMLYFEGVWNENIPNNQGIILYRDSARTIQVNRDTNHTYVKRSDSDHVYALNESGLVGSWVSTCEF